MVTYKCCHFLFGNAEVPALMADTILPPVTAVREGANVTLQCLPIMTYPAPNITWLADGMVAQVSSVNFTIAMVNESNEIVYQCLMEATFVPSTNSIGLPPSVSFITTTVIDCKSNSMHVYCNTLCSVISVMLPRGPNSHCVHIVIQLHYHYCEPTVYYACIFNHVLKATLPTNDTDAL